MLKKTPKIYKKYITAKILLMTLVNCSLCIMFTIVGLQKPWES